MGLRKRAERDAWRLFDVGPATCDQSLSGYLSRILSQCVEWFGASSASVFLREGDSDTFGLAAQAGEEAHIPPKARLRAGTGIAGLSIASGEPLLITDPLQHPALQGKINTYQVALGSSIVMPLHAAGEGCIGVLNISRSAGEALFEETDLRRLGALAGQLSLAVSNARLLSNLQSARDGEAVSRSKLEAIVQSLGVAVLVFDRRGKVTEFNRKAAELLGTDQNWQHAVEQVSPDLSRTLIDALLKARKQEYVRLDAHDRAQDRSWSIVCTPLADGGATVVLEETTLQDRSTREMSRLARLAEIGQMTAAIAHEIRNPLTGIRSAAQMIGSSPELATEFAGIIEEEVLKLNEICEEFLEFSRPLALRRRRFDLYELATKLTQRHRAEYAAKGVALRVEKEHDEPTIYGDMLRIEQVLRNLMQNAFQACPPGSSVCISVRENGFSVADTGKGMQQEDVQKLFTPFFTTKPSGTGLGLCNVRKIIDAHEGKIFVWSQPGIGSRFDVVLGEAE